MKFVDTTVFHLINKIFEDLTHDMEKNMTYEQARAKVLADWQLYSGYMLDTMLFHMISKKRWIEHLQEQFPEAGKEELERFYQEDKNVYNLLK